MRQNLMFLDSQLTEEVRMNRHVMNLETVNTYVGKYNVDALILGSASTGYQEFY